MPTPVLLENIIVPRISKTKVINKRSSDSRVYRLYIFVKHEYEETVSRQCITVKPAKSSCRHTIDLRTRLGYDLPSLDLNKPA